MKINFKIATSAIVLTLVSAGCAVTGSEGESTTCPIVAAVRSADGSGQAMALVRGNTATLVGNVDSRANSTQC